MHPFAVFDPVDFLAVLSQHIPDEGAPGRAPATRTLGPSQSSYYDLKSLPRGSPPPPRKLPSRKWRDLIRQAWNTDPLQCPVCKKQMRVIALLDDPDVVEKILRHLKLWCGPAAFAPARPPPPVSGLEPPAFPMEDDPMPDYENVITD